MELAILDAIASVATTIGVAFAAAQIFRSVRQQRQSDEDRLVEEYRRILRELPVGAMLNESIDEHELRCHLRAFYLYFDLCNQQVFSFRKRRVRKATWFEWRDGIMKNMARPAFRAAWEAVTARDDAVFKELRDFVSVPPSRHVSRSDALIGPAEMVPHERDRAGNFEVDG